MGPRADSLVAPVAQRAQQRGADLAGSADHERAHEDLGKRDGRAGIPS
jgi:hypothetical protein